MNPEIPGNALQELKTRIKHHLDNVYVSQDNDVLVEEIVATMGFDDSIEKKESHVNLWDQSDIIAISYGDTIKDGDELPLKTLHNFFSDNLDDVINTIHILPFYPFSSDDGFSVINY